jgi:hypothetical protein
MYAQKADMLWNRLQNVDLCTEQRNIKQQKTKWRITKGRITKPRTTKWQKNITSNVTKGRKMKQRMTEHRKLQKVEKLKVEHYKM